MITCVLLKYKFKKKKKKEKKKKNWTLRALYQSFGKIDFKETLIIVIKEIGFMIILFCQKVFGLLKYVQMFHIVLI